MSRTTSSQVIELLGDDYGPLVDGSNPSLTPYIDTASAYVDDVVDCASEDGVTISDARQELIERWLAAHFYKQSDKEFDSKATGNSSATHSGKTGMYLESTRYGQSAVGLDPSKCLAALSSEDAVGVGPKTVKGIWLGKNKNTQIDYLNR